MTSPLAKLCSDLIKAKAAETKAKEKRIDLEDQISSLFGTLKLDGTTTIAEGKYKISVKTSLLRTLDYAAYQSLQLPSNQSFVELKPQINVVALKAFEMFAPDLVAACVTTKPAKTSVKVEVTK